MVASPYSFHCAIILFTMQIYIYILTYPPFSKNLLLFLKTSTNTSGHVTFTPSDSTAPSLSESGATLSMRTLTICISSLWNWTNLVHQLTTFLKSYRQYCTILPYICLCNGRCIHAHCRKRFPVLYPWITRTPISTLPGIMPINILSKPLFPCRPT